MRSVDQCCWLRGLCLVDWAGSRQYECIGVGELVVQKKCSGPNRVAGPQVRHNKPTRFIVSVLSPAGWQLHSLTLPIYLLWCRVGVMYLESLMCHRPPLNSLSSTILSNSQWVFTQFAALLRGGRKRKRKNNAKWRQNAIVYHYYNYITWLLNMNNGLYS